jgi:hypothetical protein
MNRRAKAVFLVLSCAIGLRAQRSDTIFQQVFANLNTASNSSPLQNIGNSGHLLWVRMTDAPGQTCSSPQTVDIGLEGSFDASVYTPIGSQIVSIANDVNGNLVTTLLAQGAFPYVRVAVRSFNTTLCRMEARYSGTISGAATNNQGSPGLVSSAWPVKVTDGADTMQITAGGAISAQGAGASGATLVGNPVLIAGSDGANARNLLMDASGRPAVTGAAASGAAVAGNPVRIAGSDGTNTRDLKTTTSGFAQVTAQPNSACGTTVFSQALAAVPTSSTAVAASTTCVSVIVLSNTNAGTAATITVTDNAGSPITFIANHSLPAGAFEVIPLYGAQFTSGIKWSSSVSGVTGAVLGYQ